MGLKRHLRPAGIIIFAVGFFAAVLIYHAQPPRDESESDSLSKRDIYQIEKLGGKEDVIGVEMTSWVTGLWHGRRLAYTVAVSLGGWLHRMFFAGRFSG